MDDLALFRRNLARLLRSELGLGQLPPSTTVAQLLNDDDTLDRLAQAILSAPLASEQRPELRALPDENARSITCPRCGSVSYHPDDIAQGYCGRCHGWTTDRSAGDGDTLRRMDAGSDEAPLDADDEDDDEFHDTIVRAKWAMDGATTLSEAAAMLRAHADWLEQIEREGHQLSEPVSDDYGHVVPPLPEP